MTQTPVMKLKKGEMTALAARGGDRREAIVSAPALTLASLDDYVREIGTLWSRAREDYIRIGRYLNQAKVQFPEGEYMRMCSSLLPFSYQVAHQLRSIAEAIDSKRFSEAELPVAYSVAYQVVTLKDDALKVARRKKLLRPDVTRAELLALKAELREPRQPKRPPSTEREIASLEDERARLEARLREIDDRLHELRGGGATLDLTATTVADGG